jgi:serpin B
MHFLLKGVIIAFGLTLASCSPVPLCPAVKPEDAKQAHLALANFAVNLFKTVSAKDEAKNQVMSPLSIGLAMALLENGADGKTREELKHVLVDNATIDVMKVYRAIHEHLRVDDDKTKLHIANGLFKHEDLKLKDTYLSTTRDCLKTQVESVDFKNKLDETRQKINKFISEKTMEKIPELFKQGVLNKDDLMVLANAIYFKSSWMHAFNKQGTKEATFYRNGHEQEKQNVPFMHQTMDVRHGTINEVDTLEMPYVHPHLAMYIVLPKHMDGLRQLEKHLTGQQLHELINNVHEKHVEVKLPKFQIRTSLNMKDTLVKLGLESMFSHSANFDRMSDTPLKVDSAVHEAYIDVHENGTEAAAATGFSMQVRAMPSPPKEQATFVADHPFLYAIVHKETGLVIFLGKVNTIEKHDN